MLQPLASLWRHPTRVSFYVSGGLAGHASLRYGGPGRADALAARRRFASVDEAYTYLRYWLGEPASRAELKGVLQRSGPALASAQAGDEGWVRALAGRMTAGAVVVVEENRRATLPGRLVVPQSAGPSDADIADLPVLSTASPPPQAPAAVTGTPILEPDDTPVSVESEWAAPDVDQVAQAQALEQAARDGTPFCEICETVPKNNRESTT